MLVHIISFISVIAVMIYFVLIRIKSSSKKLAHIFNWRNVPYSNSRFMDGLVDASKEPFVYCYE